MNQKDNQNKKKNYLKILTDMYHTPRGKAILFFGFYFFFFLILIIAIRFGSSNNNNINSNSSTGPNYSYSDIINGNYHFTYQILLNDNNYIYEGDKINSKEKFTYTLNEISKDYYRNNDLFLENSSGNWQKTDNPYILKEYLQIDMIKTIVNSSSYISKTEYESGKITYHYEISTSTLIKLFTNENIDISDIPNKIDISVENNEVNKIDYNLESYIKYIDKNNQNCAIKITYSNFNNIEDIELPN